ncbi:hypothetical protein CSV73_09375 [Sporosarcina sp. P1]|nr:hypothetical protein CSV73_09375 [Sporosarcina sp. P1]
MARGQCVALIIAVYPLNPVGNALYVAGRALIVVAYSLYPSSYALYHAWQALIQVTQPLYKANAENL